MNGPSDHPSPAPLPARRQLWIAALFLVGITLLAYLPVWHAGFIWDDDVMLTRNPAVQSADGLRDIWFSTRLPDYFPLTSTSFWLEWRLWGNHPLGYHLVNVLLHACSALLLWRVLARLRIPGAWLAAAIFALHPVNVESVAWIAERKNTLAMVFFALTVLMYLRFADSGKRRWYWVALGTFVLALLSKTAVVMLPFVLLGIAWWRCSFEPLARFGPIESDQNSARGRTLQQDENRRAAPTLQQELWRSLPFFAVALASGLVTLWFQSHRAIGVEVVRTDGFGSRLAGAGRAVWFYLSKLIWPQDLSAIYPRWQINGSNALSYVPVLLLAAVFLLCWLNRTRWGKAGLVALGYFVVMLLPVLGFVDIYYMVYSLVADQWQYFAMIGPVALAAALLAKVTTGWFASAASSPANRAASANGLKGALSSGLSAAVLAALGLLTWRQCVVYSDLETLWQTTIARNPDCWVAYNYLGSTLIEKGRVDEAIVPLQRALEIRPDFVQARNHLADAFLKKGQVAEAIVQLQKVAERHPESADAQVNLCTALLQAGRVDEAIVHFQRALEIRPRSAAAHYDFANALVRKGQTNEAVAHYQQALEIRPGHAGALLNLGSILLEMGRVDEAIDEDRKAVQLRPGDAKAHNNLANALLQKGRTEEAIAHYQKALELDPALAEAQNNLGWLLLQRGQMDEAMAHLQKAVDLQPNLAGAHNNLANALLQKGRISDAIAQYRKAVELKPDDALACNNLAWALATSQEPSARNGTEAVTWARQAERLSGGKDPAIIGTLAAAYAEAGRFPEGVATARRAIELAEAQTNKVLADGLRAQLQLYQAGSPLRDAGLTNAP